MPCNSGDVAGAVVVVKDGEILLEKGYGYSDVAARNPVDPESTYKPTPSSGKKLTRPGEGYGRRQGDDCGPGPKRSERRAKKMAGDRAVCLAQRRWRRSSRGQGSEWARRALRLR